MKKFGIGLEKIYRIMLLLFGVLEIGILWAMSVFFICYISSDTNEMTFFCKDNPLLNIILVMLFVAILFGLKKLGIVNSLKTKLKDDEFFSKSQKIMLRIIAVLGVAWVVITQYVPGSDQLDVMSSSFKYGRHLTDMVEAGGYLDKWPHNIGITTIETVLAFFVGDYNAIFMQLLNVLGIVWIYKKLVVTWNKMGGSRLSQFFTLLCGIIFYPLIMYASFVYGNIWSLTFALIALDAELDFLERKRGIDIAKCAIAVGLSFMVKGSGIIFLVALAIIALVQGVINEIKIHKIVIAIVAMCVSVTLFSAIPKTVLEKTTGKEIRDDGIWSFVAMGLQEEGAVAGWYNGYCLNVYYDNNRDTALAEKLAKEETFNRLNYLFSDKHHAYEFFSKKIASMWIEPTYQGYWINQVRNHRVNFPGWLTAFMSAKGYTVAAKIFNVFEILILTGTVLWLILEDKNSFTKRSFFLLTVVGGFTFHLAWEIKAQYSITYFVLLFPYAIAGFEMLLEKGTGVLRDSNKIVLGYTTAVIILYLVGYVMDASHCLSNQNEIYDAYLENWTQPNLDESIYEINYMKADLKTERERNAYFVKLLNDNGIQY